MGAKEKQTNQRNKTQLKISTQIKFKESTVCFVMDLLSANFFVMVNKPATHQ